VAKLRTTTDELGIVWLDAAIARAAGIVLLKFAVSTAPLATDGFG